MKLDFNLIMRILQAVQTVEHTVKGSGTKRQKAIEIVKTAEAVDPRVEAAVGKFADVVVELSNAQAGK